MSEWKLIGKDCKELKVGDCVINYRGERLTIEELYPPKKPSSCGHYKPKENGFCGTIYYVSTIDAKFVRGENE